MDPLALYALFRLRTDIFVVEQGCAYPEVDPIDEKAWHVLGYQEGQLLACARLVPPGLSYPQPSIGRVAVRQDQRGRGLGHAIFAYALSDLQQRYPGAALKIQAQQYLERFYQQYGFRTVSAPYPDVGIMHVDMVLQG